MELSFFLNRYNVKNVKIISEGAFLVKERPLILNTIILLHQEPKVHPLITLSVLGFFNHCFPTDCQYFFKYHQYILNLHIQNDNIIFGKTPSSSSMDCPKDVRSSEAVILLGLLPQK